MGIKVQPVASSHQCPRENPVLLVPIPTSHAGLPMRQVIDDAWAINNGCL